MRHAQAMNAASPRPSSSAGTGRWRAGSRSAARAAETCRTRRAGPRGAFSVASSAAPPHSPPSPTPWPKRSRQSSQGASDADLRVARQHADQGGREAHHQHRGDQRRLAPDPVAEMAEQHRADGPREEGDAEGQEGVERLRVRRRFREERLPDHQRGGGAVDVEIVEFDRRADEAGEHDPPRPIVADLGALAATDAISFLPSSWLICRSRSPQAARSATIVSSSGAPIGVTRNRPDASSAMKPSAASSSICRRRKRPPAQRLVARDVDALAQPQPHQQEFVALLLAA